jgi:hypothetical protein
MSDAARILEVLRDAAGRGDDLANALQASGLPSVETAIAKLRAGEPLPRAIAGLIPARTAELLAGGLPPLAVRAALLADEAWRQSQRRRLIIDHLSYPLASIAMVAVLASGVTVVLPHSQWYASLASAWWALVPLGCLALLVIAPLLPTRWHMPGSGWSRHLDLAERWSRAGLAVQWRLTEAQTVNILGVDLTAMSSLLSAPGAEAHCKLLTTWHTRAARQRLALTAYIAAALVLVTAAAVVLASARMWTGAAI